MHISGSKAQQTAEVVKDSNNLKKKQVSGAYRVS